MAFLKVLPKKNQQQYKCEIRTAAANSNLLSASGVRTRSWAWLTLSLIACGIAALYSHRILQPWESYVQARNGRLLSHPGDLFPRWIGTRDLLLHGENPYGPAVSQEIQTRFYGHAIHQDYAQPREKIIDEQRFVYPIYVVFLLAPTVYLNFFQLQAVACLTLALLCAASVLLWLDFLTWRVPALTMFAAILFVLISPQIVQALRLRQLSLAVGSLLALSAWCIARNHLVTAGSLLAIATIKPQMILLPLIWFIIWALGDLRRRWRLPASFAVTFLALVGAGELLLPGWISYFSDGLVAYGKYFPTFSILEVGLGYKAGDLLAGVFILGWSALAWQHRRTSADSRGFALILALACLVAVITMPYLFMPYNQTLLILPSFMILRDWNVLPSLTRLGTVIFVAWPAAVSFIFLLLRHDWQNPSRLPLLPLCISPFLPLLILAALILDPSHRRTSFEPVQ